MQNLASRGFKLYDSVTHKFTRSRDVMFPGKKFHEFDMSLIQRNPMIAQMMIFR